MGRRAKVQSPPSGVKPYVYKGGLPAAVIDPANDAPKASLTLSLNNQPIRDRGELLSLTDMWKAAGEDPSKKPSDWSRKCGSAWKRDPVSGVIGVE